MRERELPLVAPPRAGSVARVAPAAARGGIEGSGDSGAATRGGLGGGEQWRGPGAAAAGSPDASSAAERDKHASGEAEPPGAAEVFTGTETREAETTGREAALMAGPGGLGGRDGGGGDGEAGGGVGVGVGEELPDRGGPTQTPEESRLSLAHLALWLLPPESRLRRAAVGVVSSSWFDNIITLIIVANCAVLAAYDPSKPDSAPQNQASEDSEVYFLAAFTIEMVIRVLADGFALHPGSYLRDAWNVLDFIVVVIGYLSLANLGAGLGPVRTVRLLRPLRTVGRFPGLKAVVTSLIQTVAPLSDIFILWAFMLTLFGVVGVQLFEGRLRFHCVDSFGDFDPNLVCGSIQKCPVGSVCTDRDGRGGFLPNPNFGVTNFDNFGWAIVAVFQTMTGEGWSFIMKSCVDSMSQGALVFWVLLLMVGTFFVIELAAAVIFTSYVRTSSLLEKVQDGGKVVALRSEDTAAKVMRKASIAIISPEEFRQEPGRGKRISAWIKAFVESEIFQNSVTVAIVLNTVAMAMEYHGMSPTYAKVLQLCNFVFLILFCGEMALKLSAYGPWKYITTPGDLFDGIIVLASISEVADPDGPEGLSVLRAFRLLRVLRLFKSLETLRLTILMVTECVSAIVDFFVVLCIILFTFALTGMSFFGDSLCEPGARGCAGFPEIDLKAECVRQHGENAWKCLQRPAASFSNSYYSLLTVFQIFTGENWHTVMYNAVDATSWAAVFYFIVAIILGKFVLMNLFMATIIRKATRIQNTSIISTAMKSKTLSAAKTMKAGFTAKRRDKINHNTIVLANGSSVMSRMGFLSFYGTIEDLKEEGLVKKPESLVNYSWGIFASTGLFRRSLYKLISHKWFDNTVLSLVLLSNILLALERPADGDSDLNVALEKISYVFTAIFTVEALLKITTLTLWGTSAVPGYLRDSWNQIDFFIVVLSLIGDGLELGLGDDGPTWMKSVKVIRIVRALRPLRVIGRSGGLRRVISVLQQIGSQMGNIILLLALTWLIFAILGVQVMAGKMTSCSDPDRIYGPGYGAQYGAEVASLADCPDGPACPECVGLWRDPSGDLECSGEDIVCEYPLVARRWESPTANFDDVGHGMLTLFQVATLEDWETHMAAGIATRGVGIAPQHRSRPELGLFYIIFVLLGSLLFFNLIVSVLVDRYMRLKETGSENVFLTETQETWVNALRGTLREKPRAQMVKPKHPLRARLFNLASHRFFDAGIIGCIFLNVIVMMCSHHDPSTQFTDVAEALNLVFSVIFLLEAIIKVIGFGWKQYIGDWWNRFDFLIVILTVVTYAIQWSNNGTDGGALPIDPTIGRLLRLFRGIRVLRMVKSAKGLRIILRTFIVSIPSMLNIGLMVFMAYFMFAVFGNQLFWDHGLKRGVFDTTVNFKTFESSMLLLLQISTSEGWSDIMNELNKQGYELAIFYFVTFFLSIYFLLLNMFVTVNLNNFHEVTQMEESQVSTSDFEDFADKWSEFDPKASSTIRGTQLALLLAKVERPLGLKGSGLSKLERMRYVQSLEIDSHGDDGLVHYIAVLQALCHACVGERLPTMLEDEMKAHTETAFPTLKQLPEKVASYTEIYATVLVQARLRGYIHRKRMKARLADAKKSAVNKVQAVTALRKSHFMSSAENGGGEASSQEEAVD